MVVVTTKEWYTKEENAARRDPGDETCSEQLLAHILYTQSHQLQ